MPFTTCILLQIFYRGPSTFSFHLFSILGKTDIYCNSPRIRPTFPSSFRSPASVSPLDKTFDSRNISEYDTARWIHKTHIDSCIIIARSLIYSQYFERCFNLLAFLNGNSKTLEVFYCGYLNTGVSLTTLVFWVIPSGLASSHRRLRGTYSAYIFSRIRRPYSTCREFYSKKTTPHRTDEHSLDFTAMDQHHTTRTRLRLTSVCTENWRNIRCLFPVFSSDRISLF